MSKMKSESTHSNDESHEGHDHAHEGHDHMHDHADDCDCGDECNCEGNDACCCGPNGETFENELYGAANSAYMKLFYEACEKELKKRYGKHIQKQAQKWAALVASDVADAQK